MNNIIKFSLLIILVAGCASISNKEKIQKIDYVHAPDMFSSGTYFSLAEAAFQQNDYESAYLLYKKADEANPDNIYVKEKMIELLGVLSFFNPEYTKEIIELGEDYYARDLYSAQILINLAESYNQQQKLEKADKFFQLAIETKPTMQYYLAYYLFRNEHYPPADTTLLAKALEFPWKNRETILAIAESYKEPNPSRAKEIFEKAYQKWDDEITLKSLITFYEQEKNDEKVMEILQRRIDDNKKLADPFKTFLMAKYFLLEKYQKIVDNSKTCFEVNSEEVLRYLFFSAIDLEMYELAVTAGIAIEDTKAMREEFKSFFHAYFGDVYFQLNRDDQAVEYFIKSNDIRLLLNFFQVYTLQFDPEKKERLINILHKFRENNENKEIADFLLGYSFVLLDEPEEAEMYLDKLTIDFLKENDLLVTTAIAYLTNSQNIQKARELIYQQHDQNVSANEIIGMYFYNANNDSLAYEYFNKEIEENPKPKANVYIFTSMLLEKMDDIEKAISILDKAAEIYSENADVLNSLGYIIADHEIKEKFEYAESLLTKALELQPESSMIWDSFGWLHFKMGNFRDAIKAMELPLKEGIIHSEIAYHLGEIYLKLDQPKLSEKFFRLAINLDNDDSSVELSKKQLKNELGIVLNEKE